MLFTLFLQSSFFNTQWKQKKQKKNIYSPLKNYSAFCQYIDLYVWMQVYTSDASDCEVEQSFVQISTTTTMFFTTNCRIDARPLWYNFFLVSLLPFTILSRVLELTTNKNCVKFEMGKENAQKFPRRRFKTFIDIFLYRIYLICLFICRKLKSNKHQKFKFQVLEIKHYFQFFPVFFKLK